MASTGVPTEQEKFRIGPYSVLTKAAEKQIQVMIYCRNNRKLIGRVKIFDRHCNMILQDVTEIWSTPPKGASRNAPPKERSIPKLFLRGDTVVSVLLNPFDSAMPSRP